MAEVITDWLTAGVNFAAISIAVFCLIKQLIDFRS